MNRFGKTLTILETILAVFILLASAVAYELSPLLAMFLLAFGSAGLAGGIGLLSKRLWGFHLLQTMWICLLLLIVSTAFATTMDLLNGLTSWSSGGLSFLIAGGVGATSFILLNSKFRDSL
jgi:hypothetical protein